MHEADRISSSAISPAIGIDLLSSSRELMAGIDNSEEGSNLQLCRWGADV